VKLIVSFVVDPRIRKLRRFDVVPGARVDLDSQFGNQISPKLSLRYVPHPEWELRTSYGRGFRAPSFQELLLRFENPSVGYVVAGNANLGAETSHGVDAGVSWSPGPELELSSTFFRNDLRNMIAIVSLDETSAGAGYSYKNLTSAWTMGLESSAAVRVGEVFSVQLGHTWLETWDAEQRRELEGRPRHRINGTARVRHPGWDAELNARAVVQLRRVFYTPNDDGSERTRIADPMAQVDLRASKRLGPHLELAVGVDNLLDAGDSFSVLRPFTFYGAVSGRY